MRRPNPFLFALYRLLLRFYPSRLRLRYQDEMLQSVRDACAERRGRAPRFWLRLFADLLTSSIKEHLLMIRDQAVARPVFFHALILGLILTMMGGAAAVAFQQLLRRGADEPQIQMADDYAAGLASGQMPSDVIPRPSAIVLTPQVVERGGQDRSIDPLIQVVGGVDIGRSLQPFAVVYDDSGKPIFFNGVLDQAVPTPAPGRLQLSSQPLPGQVHLAASPRRPHRCRRTPRGRAASRFRLVGRSLTLVEEQEGLLYHATFIGWFVLVGLLIAGAALLSRVQSSALTPG
jgi:hypothetical protein